MRDINSLHPFSWQVSAIKVQGSYSPGLAQEITSHSSKDRLISLALCFLHLAGYSISHLWAHFAPTGKVPNWCVLFHWKLLCLMSGTAAASLLHSFSTLFAPFFHLPSLHFDISSMNRTPVSYWKSEISLNNFAEWQSTTLLSPVTLETCK